MLTAPVMDLTSEISWLKFKNEFTIFQLSYPDICIRQLVTHDSYILVKHLLKYASDTQHELATVSDNTFMSIIDYHFAPRTMVALVQKLQRTVCSPTIKKVTFARFASEFQHILKSAKPQIHPRLDVIFQIFIENIPFEPLRNELCIIQVTSLDDLLTHSFNWFNRVEQSGLSHLIPPAAPARRNEDFSRFDNWSEPLVTNDNISNTKSTVVLLSQPETETNTKNRHPHRPRSHHHQSPNRSRSHQQRSSRRIATRNQPLAPTDTSSNLTSAVVSKYKPDTEDTNENTNHHQRQRSRSSRQKETRAQRYIRHHGILHSTPVVQSRTEPTIQDSTVPSKATLTAPSTSRVTTAQVNTDAPEPINTDAPAAYIFKEQTAQASTPRTEPVSTSRIEPTAQVNTTRLASTLNIQTKNGSASTSMDSKTSAIQRLNTAVITTRCKPINRLPPGRNKTSKGWDPGPPRYTLRRVPL